MITLSLLELPEGVNLIRLDRMGALEVKMLIERDDPHGRYLLYSPTEEPDFESDWLLDIRLYSRSFRADRASIILDQLELSNRHLRDHIALRRKFFDDKQRLQKLHALVDSNYTEIDLDASMSPSRAEVHLFLRGHSTRAFSIRLLRAAAGTWAFIDWKRRSPRETA